MWRLQVGFENLVPLMTMRVAGVFNVVRER